MDQIRKFWGFYAAALLNIIYLIFSMFWSMQFNYRTGHILSIGGITLLMVLPCADHLFASAKKFIFGANKDGVSLELLRQESQATQDQVSRAFTRPITGSALMNNQLPPTAHTWECLKDVSERLLVKVAEKTGYKESTLSDQSSIEILALAQKQGILTLEQLTALSGFYRTRDHLIEAAISAGGNTPSWVVDDAWRLQIVGEMVIQVL